MKVLLFSPANSDLISSVSIPLGLVSIATYLKKHGNEVRIVDFAVEKISVEKVLKEFQPDICGVSVRSSKSVCFSLDISKKIRRFKKKIPIVWGGPFCYNAPVEQFFKEKVIDIISYGEGEITWLELAEYVNGTRQLGDIKGIAFRDGGKITVTAEREFIDLENILPADWSVIDVTKYFQYLFGAKKLVYLYYAKGCPGRCTFCYNNAHNRNCYRKKSLETFMAELKYLVDNYGIDGFYLADEMIFMHQNELYEFCDALDATGYKLTWGGQTRIGAIDKAGLRRMYDSGCRWMDFGIESGSKRMLKKIKKGIPYELIEPTYEWCDETGIISMANFIIGIPGETVNDLKESVELAKRIKATTITFGLYCYNYTSEMGKEIYEKYKNRLPKKLIDYRKNDFYMNSLPDFSEIPKKDKYIVQGYFMWDQITKRDFSDETMRFDLFKKHIIAVVRQSKFIGLRHMPDVAYRTFLPFFRFFLTTKFCRKTLKKYGLK